ncbi:hypothetical protein CKAH01_06555 [Colletotrichum kahawae]|uniref:Uncharacterized protein n=1 Tax=Colletotrichum kahawae TaxID=34407 RepID=A0AAD9Y9U0_COLKA|nr:hypothetical protein CKAH01_06555 [Colletotrichum kahawae]
MSSQPCPHPRATTTTTTNTACPCCFCLLACLPTPRTAFCSLRPIKTSCHQQQRAASSKQQHQHPHMELKNTPPKSGPDAMPAHGSTESHSPLICLSPRSAHEAAAARIFALPTFPRQPAWLLLLLLLAAADVVPCCRQLASFWVPASAPSPVVPSLMWCCDCWCIHTQRTTNPPRPRH